MLADLSALPIGYIVAIGVVFGLLVGSFLNVVILRLPIMMQNTWQAECCDLLDVDPKTLNKKQPPKPYNLILPHSHCPKCNHKIRAWENIPVFSFLFLKGKCSDCGVKISVRYPLIELFTGLATGFFLYRYGATFQGLLALFFLWSLIALTIIDFDTQLLPDDITLPLLWLGLIANAVSSGFIINITAETANPQYNLQDAVFGAAGGYLFLWSVYWLFKLIAKKEGMGYGDFKLLAALGAWMGWQSLMIIVLLSSLVGALYGVAGILIHGRNKNQPFAFGPFLAVAGLITLLWGEPIWHWYTDFSNLR